MQTRTDDTTGEFLTKQFIFSCFSKSFQIAMVHLIKISVLIIKIWSQKSKASLFKGDHKVPFSILFSPKIWTVFYFVPKWFRLQKSKIFIFHVVSSESSIAIVHVPKTMPFPALFVGSVAALVQEWSGHAKYSKAGRWLESSLAWIKRWAFYFFLSRIMKLIKLIAMNDSGSHQLNWSKIFLSLVLYSSRTH